MSRPVHPEWLGRIGWAEAYALQEQRIAAHDRDQLLLLEHDPIITIGRTPDKSSLLMAEQSGVPVIETNRGGQATYHGPGQLVGYHLYDLTLRGRDLHVHLREIEDLVLAIATECGVAAQRREGLTGVWVQDRKLASIGVGVRHWITMHGFALNVSRESLTGFAPIVPCGLPGVQMTCLETESGRAWTVQEVAAIAAKLVES